MTNLKSIKIKIKLPVIGSVILDWEPDEIERKAAWELYVELITRVSIVELEEDEGISREALTSLYSLFPTTREILKKYGPSLALPKGKHNISLGYVSTLILNQVIRPLLVEWHPMFESYENKIESKKSGFEHEQNWQFNASFRSDLKKVQESLKEYALLLEKLAGITSLIKKKQK